MVKNKVKKQEGVNEEEKESPGEAMDCHGDHSVHLSTERALYPGCEDHRENVGFEKSVSERSGLRDAHADLLHQSRWTRTERFA
jgi:hypothetical protein